MPDGAVVPFASSVSNISVAHAAADRDPSLSAEHCRSALKGVTGSAIFRGAPRLAAFLTFVVEETLAGRAKSLKAYTIAVAALGRPDDFDPVADPIVRVEAVRLRAALVRYYLTVGAGDPIKIALPLGRYIPKFLPAEAASDPEPGHLRNHGGTEQRGCPIDRDVLLETYRGLLHTTFAEETDALVSAIRNLESEITTLKSQMAGNRRNNVGNPPRRRAPAKLAFNNRRELVDSAA